jgi:hypothetical protein
VAHCKERYATSRTIETNPAAHKLSRLMLGIYAACAKH